MKKTINIKNVLSLLSNKSSKSIIWDSIKEISPKKNEKAFFILALFIAIVPTYLMVNSIKTVGKFVESVQTINGIILALFGVVFMGYAFFQALISKELLIRLINTLKKDSLKSKLEESNEYFVHVMILDVFAIFINCLLIITIGSLDDKFHLPISPKMNMILAFIPIWIYFVIMFCIILEMKSFVINVFKLFNAYAGARAIEFSNDEENDSSGR